MKSCLTVFCLALIVSLAACSGMVPTNEPLLHESVFDVPNLTADEIHEKSKDWIALNFKSAESVIGYDDIKSHLLTGNGIINASIYLSPHQPMSFKFTLRSKDGRFKMTYSDYSWVGQIHSSHLSTEHTRNSYNQQFDELNRRLVKFLLEGGEDDDW